MGLDIISMRLAHIYVLIPGILLSTHILNINRPKNSWNYPSQPRAKSNFVFQTAPHVVIKIFRKSVISLMNEPST